VARTPPNSRHEGKDPRASGLHVLATVPYERERNNTEKRRGILGAKGFIRCKEMAEFPGAVTFAE